MLFIKYRYACDSDCLYKQCRKTAPSFCRSSVPSACYFCCPDTKQRARRLLTSCTRWRTIPRCNSSFRRRLTASCPSTMTSSNMTTSWRWNISTWCGGKRCGSTRLQAREYSLDFIILLILQIVFIFADIWGAVYLLETLIDDQFCTNICMVID